MALTFSLSAALLAILVQRWVRDYMHVFERYSDPLKSARLRQYLYDGCEGWYMPIIAEAVPGLVHVSLFLFLVGLGDSVLNINTTVGLGTAIPIAIGGLFYIFTMFAPILNPQSPYRNSISGLVWWLMQRVYGRKYKDRTAPEKLKLVSSDMSKGQMQLAMEETKERKGRDECAIRWLVHNLKEDAEMESFAVAIPGSFNTKWGVEVWKTVSNVAEDEGKFPVGPGLSTVMNLPERIQSLVPTSQRPRIPRNPIGSFSRLARTRNANGSATITRAPHPASVLISIGGENVVRDLSRRIARLLETCSSPDLFSGKDQWRKRTRACVETTASLVCCTNTKLEWFGDIRKVLSDLGVVENTREHPETGSDQLFIVRWTCLSIVVLRSALDQESLREELEYAVTYLEDQASADVSSGERALNNAQEIDLDFWQVLQSIQDLGKASSWGVDLTPGQLREKLLSCESQISMLECISNKSKSSEELSLYLSAFANELDRATRNLVRQLPGVQFDESPFEIASFSGALDFFTAPVGPQLIFPRRHLRALCSLGTRLRDIVQGRNPEDSDSEFRETFHCLQIMEKVDWPTFSRCTIERQLARLQDLRDSGGFGVTIELFFVAHGHLFSTSASETESHHWLYVGTFKSITSDWEKYQDSHGTQQVLLGIVCDIAMRRPQRGDPSDIVIPSYIADMLLELLCKVLEGQTGLHVDDAVARLRTSLPSIYGERKKFVERVLEGITQSRGADSMPLPP
jgi:Family of unknown function (DUF6535)